MITLTDGPQADGCLIVSPHAQLGYYLKLIEADKTEWLSLGDAERLDTVVEAADEWYASVGLFIPAEEAAEAVVDFITKAQRSPKVRWITPDDIPEGGNC